MSGLIASTRNEREAGPLLVSTSPEPGAGATGRPRNIEVGFTLVSRGTT
jgi:hypothetical protein